MKSVALLILGAAVAQAAQVRRRAACGCGALGHKTLETNPLPPTDPKPRRARTAKAALARILPGSGGRQPGCMLAVPRRRAHAAGCGFAPPHRAPGILFVPNPPHRSFLPAQLPVPLSLSCCLPATHPARRRALASLPLLRAPHLYFHTPFTKLNVLQLLAPTHRPALVSSQRHHTTLHSPTPPAPQHPSLPRKPLTPFLCVSCVLFTVPPPVQMALRRPRLPRQVPPRVRPPQVPDGLQAH